MNRLPAVRTGSHLVLEGARMPVLIDPRDKTSVVLKWAGAKAARACGGR